MKKLVFVLALCMTAGISFGQKTVLNEVKKELKDKTPNISELRSSIKGVLSDPETANLAEAWYVAGSIEGKQYDMEIAKAYAGLEPSDPVMFEALDAIYPYFEKAYALDKQPDEKGKVKLKHTKDMRSILKANRIEYVNAGSYFFNQKEWSKAYNNFMLFLNMPELPMMAGEKFEEVGTDSLYLQVQYYAGLAALYKPDSAEAIRIFEAMKDKGYEEENVYQLLTEEYQKTGDNANYTKMLEAGYQKFPSNSFFILTLINKSLEKEDTEKAIGYLTTAITNSPDDPFLYDILGQVYRQEGKYDKAMENLQKAITLDPNYSEGYSQLGTTHYVIADEMRLKADEIENEDRVKANELYGQCVEEYKKAIPYYEKAIELNPTDANAISSLRSIYYMLKDPRYEVLDKMHNGL